jgi:hypothetical protein
MQFLLKSITTSKDLSERLNKIYEFVSILSVIYSVFINYPIQGYELIYTNNTLGLLIESTNLFKSLKILSNYLTKVKKFVCLN